MGHAKWTSWMELYELSPDEAKEQYIEFASQALDMKPQSTSESWAPKPSTMARLTESKEWEIVQNGFHFASIGDIKQVKRVLDEQTQNSAP